MLTPHVLMFDHSDSLTTQSPIVTERIANDISQFEKNTSKTENGKEKGKGKGKRTSTPTNKNRIRKKQTNEAKEEKEESNCCSVCSKEYGESPDWICCDNCDKWLHGHCADIHTE